jgi:hypothetical protein
MRFGGKNGSSAAGEPCANPVVCPEKLSAEEYTRGLSLKMYSPLR